MFFAVEAFAHPQSFHEGQPIWMRWNFDLFTLINLILLFVLYFFGVQRLWIRKKETGVSFLQVVLFGLCLLTLVFALISPLDALSAELSSAHMVQHMILMTISAPLFVLSSPLFVMSWGLPKGLRALFLKTRFRMGKSPTWKYFLWQPVFLWALHALTLWIWHYPTFYEAALQNTFVHDVQHVSFFVVSVLFWRVLLDPLSRFRMPVMTGVLYLFTTSLHATALGVYMALAPSAWYPFYESTTAAWSLTPLEDQQIAGFIMWMPACMVYAAAAAGIFVYWMKRQEKRAYHI